MWGGGRRQTQDQCAWGVPARWLGEPQPERGRAGRERAGRERRRPEAMCVTPSHGGLRKQLLLGRVSGRAHFQNSPIPERQLTEAFPTPG